MVSINITIWKQVEKMYRHHLTEDELKTNLDGLNLSEKYVEKSDLIKYFLMLNEHDALVVIQDVLQIPEFWLTDYDKIGLENNEIQSDNVKSLDPSYSPGLGNISPSGYGKSMWRPVKYNPPEHRKWASELIRLLMFRGIIYNKTTNNFILKSKDHELMIDVSSSQSDLLIKSKFEDYFYSQIIDETNGTFLLGYYIATVILIRKLFENLIIDLLKMKFPPDVEKNKELYFMENGKRHKDFKDLIKVLAFKKTEIDDGHGTIETLSKRLTAIKELGNKNAHRLTYIATRDEINNLRLTETIALILRLMNK